MSSPARRMRRAQARQVAKQLVKAQPPTAPSAPAPHEQAAQRLAQLGVTAQRSLIWTPPAR